MSGERDDAMIDEFGFPRLCALPRFSGWMTRAFTAITADLRSADCGSLDVLLYCPEDVSVSTPRDRKLIEPAR